MRNPVIVEPLTTNLPAEDKVFSGAKVSEDELERIYARTCGTCHGDDLKGSVGPELTTIGAKYSKEEIEDIIKNGIGSMPPFDYFDDDEREILVDWLAGLK